MKRRKQQQLRRRKEGWSLWMGPRSMRKRARRIILERKELGKGRKGEVSLILEGGGTSRYPESLMSKRWV